MPTNPNMVAIQTVTVGSGGAATIEFTNIPQTYTDLVVKLSALGNGTEGMYVEFNGSTANFSGIYLYGEGSSVLTGSLARYVGSIMNQTQTPNNTEIYIPNYTGSNNKSFSVDNVQENNGTVGYNNLIAGLWSNSAAITSITITAAANFRQYSSATLYGVTSSAYGAKATGGIITETATHYIHTFLASGTFTPTSNLTADYLVVAGGGGGADNLSGGGGARALTGSDTFSASTNYTVTIGAGGAPSTAGNSSVFATNTCTGGGGATAGTGNPWVATGGSGSKTISGTTTNYTGGAGGGNATPSPITEWRFGGGGAGSNANGSAGSSTANSNNGTGGNGGAGITSSISGTSVEYAGGGGGGAFTTGGTATGGGGAGGKGSGVITNGTNGTANTGGGGGGGGGQVNVGSGSGGTGGSGIVIVRYAK